MKLLRLDYSQWREQPQMWEVKNIEFQDINLIVGINATGKTRLLNVISNFARIISGKKDTGTGNFLFKFLDGEDTVTYELRSTRNRIEREEFKKNSQTLLKREEAGTGHIFAEEIEQNIQFGLGKGQLAFSTKRDSVQHPFLENLAGWAENVRYYKFGEDMGRTSFEVRSDESNDEREIDTTNTEQVASLFYKGQETFTGFRQSVVHDFKMIGYPVDDIKVEELTSVRFNLPIMRKPLGLVVKEKDLGGITEHFEMSQGMFRALSLLIHINYLSYSSPSSCILIDDIGEGLDFDRSTGLIKLLIEKAKASDFQLIMTTNDRFVMNAVPLKYWSVLIRSGQKCKALNYSNSQNIFDEFELTGLNNFDFFASKFWEEAEKQENV